MSTRLDRVGVMRDRFGRKEEEGSSDGPLLTLKFTFLDYLFISSTDLCCARRPAQFDPDYSLLQLLVDQLKDSQCPPKYLSMVSS
jgi:hypothetical protein